MSEIRSLHLDIIFDSSSQEKWWGNRVLEIIAREMKSLQHIYINIEQRSKWKFKEPAACSFLEGLRSLIHLKLKTATVIVSDYHMLHRPLSNEQDGAKRWTMSQKQEWARHIKRVLLHQDAVGNLAIGEAV